MELTTMHFIRLLISWTSILRRLFWEKINLISSQLPQASTKELSWGTFSSLYIYEGVSINNQPIPFPMDRTETVTIFMLCFNI